MREKYLTVKEEVELFERNEYAPEYQRKEAQEFWNAVAHQRAMSPENAAAQSVVLCPRRPTR